MAVIGAVVGFGAGAAGVIAAGISSIAIGAVAGALAGAVFDYVMEQATEDAQSDTMGGRTVSGRDPVASRKIAYGECRTGGTIVYLANSGEGNEHLHQMTCFAVGECESIEEIWYGDKMVMKLNNGTPKYYDEWSSGSSPSTTAKHTYIRTKTGTIDQTKVTSSNVVGKQLPNQWSANHRLLNICYAYTRFDLDEGHPYDGQPNVTARIKGRKLYDPRKDSTSSISNTGSHRPNDSSTWEYSNNSALCVLDYLTDSEYGANISHDDINYPALQIALNICDENVTTANGTQKRYTCDGIIDTKSSLRNNVATLLSSMNGKITFSGGEFFIDAYAYKTPHSVVVDESMMLGNFTIRTKQSRRDSYNQVRGTFMSANDNFQMSEFPTKTFSQYVQEDGEILEHEMKLSMTTDVEAAQRLARLTLLRSRMQDTIKMQLNMKGLQYKVGDNIKVSNAKFGIVEKEIEITRLSIQPNEENGIIVNIEGKETQQSIFDWQSSYADAYDSGNTIELYDPNRVTPVTGMIVLPIGYAGDDELQLNTPVAGFRVSWDAISDSSLRYRVTVRDPAGAYFKQTKEAYKNFVEFNNLRDNEDYEVTIEVVNSHYYSVEYTETHRTGRSTDFGGGEYTIVRIGTPLPMTAQEFSSYFQKGAKQGDQLTVLQIDPTTRKILDSISYVFHLDLVVNEVTGYVPNGTRYGNFPHRSDNHVPAFQALILAPIAFEDVTWTVTASSFTCSDDSITSFTNISIVEVFDNTPSGSQARLVITTPIATIDSRQYVDAGYPNLVYYENALVTVTATWDNQTHSETVNAFIAMQMDT